MPVQGCPYDTPGGHLTTFLTSYAASCTQKSYDARVTETVREGLQGAGHILSAAQR